MEVKKALRELSTYKPGKPIADVKKEFQLDRVVKLASNENPFGMSEKVSEGIIKSISETHYYPDGNALELKEALQKWHEVEFNQLLVGSGLDDVIQILCRTLLELGDEVIVATPTFSQYAHHAIIEGAKVREVPCRENNGEIDLEGMLAAINPQTKIIWICNPNNPTGSYLSQSEISIFLTHVPKGVIVVSDEAYFDYVTIEEQASALPLTEKYGNLLIMRTFSKIYGLANLRLGYCIGNPKLIEKMEIVRLPFNTSLIAQRAGIIALGDREFVTNSQKVTREEMLKWENFLEEMKLTFYLSQANFIFFDTGRDATTLTTELMKKGYIVRAGLRPTWLRVTIGTPDDNEAIQGLLRKLLS